jgi:hypothetical protein
VPLAGQALALRFEVAEERAPRAPRDERRRQRLQLGAQRVACEEVRAADEEREQHRR